MWAVTQTCPLAATTRRGDRSSPSRTAPTVLNNRSPNSPNLRLPRPRFPVGRTRWFALPRSRQDPAFGGALLAAFSPGYPDRAQANSFRLVAS